MINHQEASKGKVRGLAVFLLVLQIGIAFAYGFGTTMDLTLYSSASDQSTYLISYTLSSILALLGWGLIIAYSQNSALSGLATTLISAGITVQLLPLTYLFWKYCFLGFDGTNAISILGIRLSMVALTSLMVALSFLSGRLGLIETVVTILVFNFGWPMCYWFFRYLFKNQWSKEIQVMDSNGGNYIYVFGSVFGIVASFIINIKQGQKSVQGGARYSAFIGLIGTGFVFAAFPFSGVVGNLFAWFEQSLNVYFSMTASVIMTYWSSTAFGRSKPGVRQALVGVLGGGVIISVVPGYIANIGGAIAVGGFAGVVSGLWLAFAHPKINQNKTYDHLGLIGPILINAFLGGFAVAPLLFVAFKNETGTPKVLNMPIRNQRQITYFLTINGIAIACGIFYGAIAGAISLALRNPTGDFRFTKLISNDFGLYSKQNAVIDVQAASQTAAPLNSQGRI